MKSYIFTIIVVLVCSSLNATPQMPEQLVFAGDTLDLFANPFSPYSRQFRRRLDFSPLNDYIYSTGCYRGYVGIWSIKNDSLFLNEITTGDHRGISYRILNEEKLKDTNLPEDVSQSLITNNHYYNWNIFSDVLKDEVGSLTFRRYRKEIADCYEYNRDSTERIRADLNLLLDERKVVPTENSNHPIFAEWFSGELICPIGEMLKYVHRTYGSIYEQELHLFIKQGVVTYSFMVTNEPLEKTVKDSTNNRETE